GPPGRAPKELQPRHSARPLVPVLRKHHQRLATRQISELRGLQRSAPVLAGVFMVVMLSSIGLPGLNGFVGEFLVLIGTFVTRRWWAVVAVSGVILAAVYLLLAYQSVCHGTPDEAY